MSCDDTWETSVGSILLHEMTDEHLRNAIAYVEVRVQLAEARVSSKEHDLAESERRLDQLRREVARRRKLAPPLVTDRLEAIIVGLEVQLRRAEERAKRQDQLLLETQSALFDLQARL